YYEWLFDDLLSFPFDEGETAGRQIRKTKPSSFVEPFSAVARDPLFAPKPIDICQPDVIRLDYGEFEAPVPNALVKGLVKGFLEGPAEGLSALMKNRIVSYLDATRNSRVPEDRIVVSQGAFPLFGNLIEALAARLKRPPVVAVPDGTYGP